MGRCVVNSIKKMFIFYISKLVVIIHSLFDYRKIKCIIFIRLIISAILPLFICSCSIFKGMNLAQDISLIESLSVSEGLFGFKPQAVKIKNIIFNVDKDANQDKAILADLIIIYKNGPLSDVMKMTPAEYFSKKKTFIAENASTLEVQSFELVPGINITRKVKISRKRPIAAFLLVHYWHGNSTNKFRLGSGKSYIVNLHENHITVTNGTLYKSY